MGRKKIPDSTKLELWVKSAGRCEFKGCNEPVWRNGLTLSEGNFAEVAHIIGSSIDGPRGTEESEELQVDFSNLMLLCQRCHKEIDDHPEQYSIELLREWKEDHENRIEMVTDYPEEIHKSTILMCSINIGDRNTPINIQAIKNAMFPKYPIDMKGIKIEEQEFDRNNDAQYWQTFAESKIQKKIKRAFEDGIADAKLKHLSVFGIAPMPFLMYLGKCIGDTVPTDIYQSNRTIENTSQTWSWSNSPEPEVSYMVSSKQTGTSKEVFLLLALSDYILEDKYKNILTQDSSVYELTISQPSPHFITKANLSVFSAEYRKILNDIQAFHGKNCVINILPAIPVSVAIEAGRIILPTKDPQINVWEYFPNNGFRNVLRIN